MNHQTIAVADLSLDPSNVRKHSRRNLDAIKASLRKFGQQKPIVVDAKGIVLAGNGTLTAAKELGWTEIQIVRTELAGVEATAFAIADNRTAELAEWDEDGLANVLQSLKVDDADLLAATGYDAAEVDKMSKAEVTEDEVPEPPVEPITKAGDLWILGEHRVLCGDSTKAEDVERLMAGEKADMVFTDPPYGMHLDTDYSSMKSKFGPRSGTYSAVAGDNLPFDPRPLLALFPAAREIFLWGADYYAERVTDRLEGSWVVWDKRAGEGVSEEREESLSRTFGSGFELCWSKRRHQRLVCRILWNGMFGMGKDDEQKRVHPTQKPVALAKWFFERWGKLGDRVADLFLGSGSTLIAAEQLGRKCYGMEISPAYCDVIVQRWENLTGKKAVLEKPTT